MNRGRRAFFRQLPMAAATVLPTATASAPPPAETPLWPTLSHPLHYQDYMLLWAGWKPSIETAMFAGQWLAWPLLGIKQRDFPDRPPYLYLNVPNFVGGPYLKGACFCVMARDGRVMGPDTPDVVADGWIGEGLPYIKQLVDGYGHRRGPLEGYPLHHFPLPPLSVLRGVSDG